MVRLGVDRQAGQGWARRGMDRQEETLIAIEAPHFYAGLVARHGRVIEAADIIRYMRGWDGQRVADYCKQKGWAWSKVTTTSS